MKRLNRLPRVGDRIMRKYPDKPMLYILLRRIKKDSNSQSCSVEYEAIIYNDGNKCKQHIAEFFFPDVTPYDYLLSREEFMLEIL